MKHLLNILTKNFIYKWTANIINLIISLLNYNFLNKITIHTIGDSHAQIPWEKIKHPKIKININNLGARLMYRVGRDQSLINLTKFKVKNGEIVIYCFGEIDCRCHVWKYRSEGYKNIIDDLVDKYMGSIRTNTGNLPNLTICIYNVVPPIKKEEHLHNEVPELPFSGSNETRKKYVNYMNEKLLQKCGEMGFVFFNVYENYCDEEGFLNFNLSDKNVHIGEPKHIIAYIKSHFMKT